MRRILAGAVGVGLVIVLAAGCGGGSANKAGVQAAPHVAVLTLANTGGDVDPSLQLYVEAVNRRSHGAVQIQIESGYRQGDQRAEFDTIRDVQSGKAQLAWVGARAWDTVGVQSFRALVAPFLVDSYPLQQRVLASPLGDEMLASLQRLGVVGLAVLPGPFRRLVSRRPVLSPADLAGTTIAVTPTQVARATARALGARPAVLIPNEQDVQVPKDVVAIESQFQAIYGNQYYRSFHYLTRNLDLWPRSLVVFANRKVFDSLSHAQQQALRLGASDALGQATAVAKAGDNGTDAAASLCQTDVRELVASPADLAAFRRAVAPVYTTLDKDPQTRSLIARIEAVKRRLAVPPDPGPPCASQAALGAKPTPLDGVYVLDVSLQEEAGLEHVDPSQVDPANYGHQVSVLDRGRFAGTQENGPVCTWNYGTYTVVGDRFETRVTDGGGVGTQAYGKPGEFFAFRYSLYRDLLTLKPVPPSPPDLPGGPFGHRVTTTPSASYLSTRCPPPSKALPGGIPSPVDGVYRGHFTPQQAAARDHIPVSQEESANYGDFVWVFDRGRFADTQRSGSVCTWQYGRFAVKKDRITVTYTDGGGFGTLAYNKPGESFHGRWSLYRNVLTTTAFASPLTRVSKTPSRKALLLSRHCRLPAQALR